MKEPSEEPGSLSGLAATLRLQCSLFPAPCITGEINQGPRLNLISQLQKHEEIHLVGSMINSHAK